MRIRSLLLSFTFTASLSAKVEWKTTNETRSTESLAQSAEVILRLTDDRLESALDFGDIEVSEALDEKGNSLISSKSEQSASYRPLRIRPTLPPSADIRIPIKCPEREANSIQTLKGAFSIRTFKSQKVVIDPAKQPLNEIVENDLLDAHGLEVTLIDIGHAYPEIRDKETLGRLSEQAVAVEISSTKTEIREIELITTEFEVIPSQKHHFGTRSSMIWGARANKPLPEGYAVRISIPIAPEEHRILFDLKDLPLP
ncbi:MAG: hypothetical protein AAFY98_10185 [Verrucomicrobiota bacterium]